MAYKEDITSDSVLPQVPEDGLVKPKWLRQHLKLTSNNLSTYKSRGIMTDQDGFWNLREICQFLVTNPKGQCREDRRIVATEILKKIKGVSTEHAGLSLVFENMDEGLEGSLCRARQMEKHVSMQAQEIADDPILLASHLKTWKDVQDLLRKHESESLAILEKQKHMIPKEEVYEFFNTKVTPTVTKLRSVPEQIIEDILEQDDRTVVLEIMEKAIDKALEEVSKK